MKVSITSESRYPVDRSRVRKTVKNVLEVHGVLEGKEVEVDICFVGDRKMKSLNQEYLDRDRTTDVLSFSLVEENREIGKDKTKEDFVSSPDGVLRLGEVIVSYPQARKQAKENSLLVDEEVDRLVEHGLLHLLGIHHEGDR
jgi:probable rRNA maturation factor